MPITVHWSERYLGLPYNVKTFNCAHLAVRVRKEIFNQDISLPVDMSSSALARMRQIQEAKLDYATPTDSPQDGDAVLLVTRGRSQHIGILCRINEEDWILHNAQVKEGPEAPGYQGGVARHRIRDLYKWGWTVEGYYKWI